VSDNGDGSNRRARKLIAGQNEIARLTVPGSQRVIIVSKRILVADDSDTVRRVVRAYLSERDFDVCGEAVDGEDAIEKAWQLKPDLILLDVAMPKTNGIVAASVLKEMMPNLRIVLLTMYSDAVARAFPRKGLAADVVVAKAEGMNRLAECVQSLLLS
jgi:DNA-binding NarL/FixJ family response regulator